MMNCCPRVRDMNSPAMRAETSLPPPAANGTIIVTGRVGGLRPRQPRDCRQRGSARGQMQEISAGKFHLNLPLGALSVNHVVGAAACGVYALLPGRRTVKTEPLPGSLATVTSPPIMRASLRESARPSPVPP